MVMVDIVVIGCGGNGRHCCVIGCGGNVNNFETMEECRVNCLLGACCYRATTPTAQPKTDCQVSALLQSTYHMYCLKQNMLTHVAIS